MATTNIFAVILLLLIAIVNAADDTKSDDRWVVYYSGDFDKNAMCSVLSCRKHDACLVKDNNAMCIKKHKIADIKGVKVYHHTGKSMSSDDQHKQQHHTKYDVQSHQQIDNDITITDGDKMHTKKKAKHRHEHKHQPRHDGSITADCDEKELRSMGGRLLQWFTDVHTHAEVNQELPLPDHHITCRRDVSWMFQQWDGNSNGELSIDELHTLESDKHEHCIKPFLDRCDDDGDNAISLDEWCDCFTWADDVRHEPPCHAAQHKNDPHLLGVFHPRCDVDGYYKTEQCHEHVCWCVDRYGREFDRSRSIGKMPDCGQYASTIDDDAIDHFNLIGEL